MKAWKESSPLKKWRLKNKISRRALAELIGVSSFSIQGWEEGTRAPHLEHLGAIRRVTGITCDTLIAWFEAKPKPGEMRG